MKLEELNKADDVDDDDDDDDEGEIGTPIASLLFDFLTDSRSSIYARVWSGLTIALVLARIMALSLESCSGPNQYEDRPKDLSDFHFLLTKDQYWSLYIALMVPLIIDGFARLLFLLLILWESENHPIYEKFRGDLMEVFLFCTDVIGLIPFFAQAAYYQGTDKLPTNAGAVTLSMMELFLTGRIFRVVRKYPAIQAITRALSRAAEHLILPLFFFFVFNITAGVFFYFSQPCYNVNSCAWKNLFDATFYSIVSMTTTGYGNQIPYFEAARFIACLVMMFGALFLSMPLAIIGNEYDRAWNEIKEENRILEEQKATAEGSSRMKSSMMDVDGADGGDPNRSQQHRLSLTRGSNNHSITATVVSAADLTLDDKKRLLRHQPVMTILEQIHRILQRLHEDYRNSRHHIPHTTVIALCEMKAWIPTFCLNIEQTITLMTTISSQEFLTNMTEMVVENISHAATNILTTAPGGIATHTPFGGGGTGGIFGGRGQIQHSQNANNDLLHRLQEMKKLNQNQHLLDAIAGPSFDPSMADDMGGSYHTSREGSVQYHPDGDGDNASDNGYDSAGDFSNYSISDYDGDHNDDGDNHDNRFLEMSKPSNLLQGNNVAATNQQRRKSSEKNSNSKALTEQKRNDPSAAATATPNPQSKFSKIVPMEISSSSSTDPHKQAAPTKTLTFAEKTNQIMPATGVSPIPSVYNNSTNNTLLDDEEGSEFDYEEPSLWSRFKTYLGCVPDTPTGRNRTLTQDVADKLERVKEDPDSWRNRIWVMLEVPSSSREARGLQVLLIVLISISIFSLYTQTVTKFTLYGETTKICGEVVNVYCGDKFNAVLDPGCYAHYPNGTISTSRLRFHCDELDCFGHGANFGASSTALNCSSNVHQPFQNQESLRSHYGTPTLLFDRLKMHRSHEICSRIECLDNSVAFYDASGLWIAVEFVMNIIFSIEIGLRILVSDSVMAYWKDKMNLMDLLAILPFYSEMFSAAANGGFKAINFSILASSPEDMFLVYVRALKVFRLVKLSRHFRASKVLLETARRVVMQIFGMLAFLAFLVLLFAIILYQLEKGHGCYVDDVGCLTAEDISYMAKPGQFIWVNKNGSMSSFPNVFYAVWFSFVTITTVGYGDIVPITQGGMIIGIFLMVAGQFYMAMPLTATATTFYQVHEQYEEDSHAIAKAQASLEHTTTSANAVQQRHNSLSKAKEAILDPLLLGSVKQLVRHLRVAEHQLSDIVDDIQSSPFSMFDAEILEKEKALLKARGTLAQTDRRLSKNNLMKAAQLKHRIAKLCKELEEHFTEHEGQVADVLLKYQDLLTGKIFDQVASASATAPPK